MSIIIVGDLMVDVSAGLPSLEILTASRGSDLPSDITLNIGGSATNTAAWLSHVSVETVLLGARGSDPLGEYLDQHLTRNGLSHQLKVDATRPTGICIVLNEANGERTMIPSPGANAFISTLDYSEIWPNQPITHLHVTGYSLFHPVTGNAVLEFMQRCNEMGCTISFDPSAHTLIAPNIDRISKALEMTDLLLTNEQEAIALRAALNRSTETRDQMSKGLLEGLIQDMSNSRSPVLSIAITLGSAGAIAGNRTVLTQPISPPPVETVLATTGAGDAFNAGFIKLWTRSPLDLEAACNAGNALASLAVSRVGTSPLDVIW
jgi:sugar/nucleoside kinase (ribokinase family)